MTRQVFQSPLFARQKSRLHKNEGKVLDNAVRFIQAQPEEGEAKKGDLYGVYTYKFKMLKRQMLLAYEYDDTRIVLLTLGPHENFYRDLKQYLK
jgi:mRNA interferase RelE/StbE